AEQEGQQTETEATGAPQKHHYTLNQQVGSITLNANLKNGRRLLIYFRDKRRVFAASKRSQQWHRHQRYGLRLI
ncbi:hypothetical protein, partial [Klebsiella pneumoniae]|uniref:hypothetical protein n=1 Tax=Klebsiella pneumoniae TaxID=573 RepID=UPI001C6E8B48